VGVAPAFRAGGSSADGCSWQAEGENTFAAAAKKDGWSITFVGLSLRKANWSLSCVDD